ncbi:hypothetical protein [Actinomadura decatromicini]|uniref:Uncharacterized protein n=1 Tax=Actinomadura decatromicini TaxID=2604572 RepID=A0A5D3FA93_9ACTN|nr:hypothetical protein [Actinomadura decatromicini]TYK45123.1 hypothetical protein FXF68_31055 [Actinomadura decatromicini]
MGWVVLLPTAAVWWVINRKVSPKRPGLATMVSIATMALAWIAGCGLAYTFAGRWIATIVSSWAGGGLARITGEPGIRAGFVIAVTLLAVLIAVVDIAQDRRADGGAQFSAFFMPTLLALVVGGTLGETGGGAVQSVTSQVAMLVSQIGGA